VQGLLEGSSLAPAAVPRLRALAVDAAMALMHRGPHWAGLPNHTSLVILYKLPPRHPSHPQHTPKIPLEQRTDISPVVPYSIPKAPPMHPQCTPHAPPMHPQCTPKSIYKSV